MVINTERSVSDGNVSSKAFSTVLEQKANYRVRDDSNCFMKPIVMNHGSKMTY